jgi:hypothetical protein
MLEMKTSMNQIQSTVDSIISRQDQTEENGGHFPEVLAHKQS